MTTPPTDILLSQDLTVSGRVVALNITNGLDSDDPDFALLPDGEVLVTLHVKKNEPSPSRASTYATVYSSALDAESRRPLAERTHFSHDVAANAVASHALQDLVTALEDADPIEHPLLGLDEMVAFVNERATNLPGHSATLTRHRAALEVVREMTPAHAAWVTRNSTAVKRRLEDFVDEKTARVLLAHFNISVKDD